MTSFTTCRAKTPTRTVPRGAPAAARGRDARSAERGPARSWRRRGAAVAEGAPARAAVAEAMTDIA